MLVLARRKGEAICIGEGIIVQVAEIRGSTVRLAIQAPHHVRVDRQEVRVRKDAARGARLLRAGLATNATH